MITLDWLSRAFQNPRAGVILRKNGEDWVSAKRAWKIEEIAKEVYNPSQVIGIRPEGLVRTIFLDFDHKTSKRVSPYWHQKAKSLELIKLEEEAEAHGLQVTFLVSSHSGGLHAIVSLPSAVKAWLAHWIGIVLLEKCNMKEESGQAEVFPSEIKYIKSADPSSWAQSHGVRLPGQTGSKLIAGERFVEDIETIYKQLIADIDNTQDCQEWDNLISQAKKRAKTKNENKQQYWTCKNTSIKKVKWTQPGQSENNLRQITTIIRAQNPDITSEEELAKLIREAAINAEGFWEFASSETRKELSTYLGWALRWARSSLRKIMQAGKVTTPKERKQNASNRRVYESNQNRLRELYATCPESASWSLRKIARETGLAKRTVAGHQHFWYALVGHPKAPITGGVPEMATEPEPEGNVEAESAETEAPESTETTEPAIQDENRQQTLAIKSFFDRIDKVCIVKIDPNFRKICQECLSCTNKKSPAEPGKPTKDGNQCSAVTRLA